MHGMSLGFQIKDNDIQTAFSTKAVEINEKGVICEGMECQKFFEADTVIYAVGQRPLWEETDELRFCAPEFHQIGDCLVPKNIQASTSLAFHIARDIGRK